MCTVQYRMGDWLLRAMQNGAPFRPEFEMHIPRDRRVWRDPRHRANDTTLARISPARDRTSRAGRMVGLTCQSRPHYDVQAAVRFHRPMRG